MVKVIGVRFPGNGKMYYFDPLETVPEENAHVLVETSRGKEVAEVVMPVTEMNDEAVTFPLKPIIRIADAQDLARVEENRRDEKEAYEICQKKIEEHALEMKLVNVEYAFDRSKILFYFTANGRVDFRALVKDLAAIFKTRIELRQIGVRDEARMLGGLGTCGRPICCRAFLNDFQPVSIKMAKEQKLSLNPTKISGVCGRLMCCLKYEEDHYEATHKRMPKIGREIQTPDGPGIVTEQNMLQESVRVRFQRGDTTEVKDYPLDILFPETAVQPGCPACPACPASPAEPVSLTTSQYIDPEEIRIVEDTESVELLEEVLEDEGLRDEPRGGRNRKKQPRKKQAGKPRDRKGRKPRLTEDGEQETAEATAPETVSKPAPATPAPRTEAEKEPRREQTPPPAAPAQPARSTSGSWKEALERAMERANSAMQDS